MSTISNSDLEWWADVAAHPAPYRQALAHIEKAKREGKRMEAYWCQTDSRVKVRSAGECVAPAPKRVSKAITKPLKPATQLQVMLLDSIPKDGATTSELARAIGKPVAGTNSSLQSLLTAGLVTMQHKGENLFWTKTNP